MTDLQTYGHSALQALNATFSKEQADTLLALLAAHTSTIADVDGLEDRLSAIEGRLDDLEGPEV